MFKRVYYVCICEGWTQVKNDISLPISKIPDFVKYITRKFNQLYPDGSFINFGHIGDGNLHFNFAPFFNKVSLKKVKQLK